MCNSTWSSGNKFLSKEEQELLHKYEEELVEVDKGYQGSSWLSHTVEILKRMKESSLENTSLFKQCIKEAEDCNVRLNNEDIRKNIINGDDCDDERVSVYQELGVEDHEYNAYQIFCGLMNVLEERSSSVLKIWSLRLEEIGWRANKKDLELLEKEGKGMMASEVPKYLGILEFGIRIKPLQTILEKISSDCQGVNLEEELVVTFCDDYLNVSNGRKGVTESYVDTTAEIQGSMWAVYQRLKTPSLKEEMVTSYKIDLKG